MQTISKWAFKRLLDELTEDQYEQMIAALRSADVPMPGWTDRLAPEPKDAFPVEAIRVLVPLEDLVRALGVARTARRADYYNDPKGGVWLLASGNQLRVCGSDDYAAAFMDLTATVDVPGTVIVDARDIWQITEALRKGTPRAQRSATHVILATEGDGHIRIAVDGRSHRAKLLGRPSVSPPLPPIPQALLVVPDGAAVRRAVLHVAAVVDVNASRRSKPTDYGYIGLRSADGTLTIDAGHEYRAAQANLPIAPGTAVERLVHYLWLREITVGIGAGAVSIGHVTDVGEHGLVMVSGDGWAAWTSLTRPWRSRFVPKAIPDATSITFHRDDVQRHLTEAKRLAEASWAGQNSTLIRITVSDGALTISSLTDSESAHTGSVRVAGEAAHIGATPATHLRIATFLDALEGFAKQDVSICFGQSGVVYATTAGYQPEEHPPLLAAVPTATPSQVER